MFSHFYHFYARKSYDYIEGNSAEISTNAQEINSKIGNYRTEIAKAQEKFNTIIKDRTDHKEIKQVENSATKEADNMLDLV